MDLDLPTLHGIIPPLPTTLHPDESLDLEGYERLIEFQITAGVHGLWVLGTTSRFDLITDSDQRRIAETAIRAAGQRLPMVLNVSDMGTKRTITRARMFDDLPYDYYAALPPWYQPMTPAEVTDFYVALADELTRPLVIYNAPWICNQLSFEHLRRLAEHPRIVGCKDVSPSLTRTQDWTIPERRRLNFSYLHGNDLMALSTELGSDGFVCSIANTFPELCVAIWEAAQADDAERAFRLQTRLCRLSQGMGFGTYLACLEAALKHRGLLGRMLPRPLRSLEKPAADRVAAHLDAVGVLPEPVSEAARAPEFKDPRGPRSPPAARASRDPVSPEKAGATEQGESAI